MYLTQMCTHTLAHMHPHMHTYTHKAKEKLKIRLLIAGHFKILIYFFKDFYSFIHERQRERQRLRQKEKQAPCREPDVGLDPRTLGTCPKPKAESALSR